MNVQFKFDAGDSFFTTIKGEVVEGEVEEVTMKRKLNTYNFPETKVLYHWNSKQYVSTEDEMFKTAEDAIENWAEKQRRSMA